MRAFFATCKIWCTFAPLLTVRELCVLNYKHSESCLSGRKSHTRNVVYALRRTGGSNPSLSAKKKKGVSNRHPSSSFSQDYQLILYILRYLPDTLLNTFTCVFLSRYVWFAQSCRLVFFRGYVLQANLWQVVTLFSPPNCLQSGVCNKYSWLVWARGYLLAGRNSQRERHAYRFYRLDTCH